MNKGKWVGNLWKCVVCGFENDDEDTVCKNCSSPMDVDSGDYGGADESDFGGDPLWDDDQELM